MQQPVDIATRRFLKAAAAGGVALALPGLRAQGVPRTGAEYRAVNPPQQTDVQGKLEVLEFFWYGCPHCNAFDPALNDWVKRLPSDVVFRKVHVGLGPGWVTHQQLFYTLEATGQADALNPKIFHAIHVERNPLNRPDAMADLVARNGVDRKKFLETYESFAVRTRVRRANQQAAGYGVDGVPSLAVNGRWYTAPSMAGGNAQVLRVLDYLLERERKGGR